MIKLIKKGIYKLIETKSQTKIIIFDDEKKYAWINAKGIGEILVSTHINHKTDAVLAVGPYRIYSVQNEPNLTDLLHLELSAGQGIWQGYLLLTGFPTNSKKRNRIVPTKEVITKSTLHC